MTKTALIIVLAGSCLIIMPAAAQVTTIRATPIRTAVTLDGRLDETFWATADSIDDFRQREPLEGSPATERTVVKVAHDADALYIVVRCYDSNMRGVRASQLRRDADLSSDDNVRLLIDSFDDRRSAFVFATNPNGALWDAQFSGVDDLNENWNGIWEVAVSRDSAGWTARFRIPLLALRFRAGTNTEFGFNVRRFIRRKNEEVLWRSYGRTQGFYRLNNEGAITDLGDLRRPRDLELYPYALGRAVETEHDSVGRETRGGYLNGKAGVDAKLGITPTLTADATVNTDFAQAEADQQVINLTRFPFFFPEKREFFLESSGQFDLGTPGRVQLFYSRRIGLDTSGAPVPIVAGGRIYGRLGPWKLGFLDAQTGGADNANDAVVRIQRDLFDRSYIGAIGTLHAGPRGQGVERAGGLDIELRAAAGLRPPHGHLGDDGARRLHATARSLGNPAARFHVSHPELGRDREREGFIAPECRLADGVVRVASVWGRPAEWRSLRSQHPTVDGCPHGYLRHRSARRDPAGPLLVVSLRAAVLHERGPSPELRSICKLGAVLRWSQHRSRTQRSVARRWSRHREHRSDPDKGGVTSRGLHSRSVSNPV